ncbi:MAG: sugar/nucleoside kinase (ribokinase family), partial [Candidatus Woesearchaeota archaeon]
KSLKTQKALAKEVKKSGTKIVYNPSEYQVRKGITPIKPLLSLCDILIFNRTEAQILTGKKSSTAILKFLHNLGINIVVITDGPNTIECSNGSHIIKLEPKRVKVKEATGAGDAFSSGFISWYIKTNDLVQSLHAGLANSESVLQHYGAKDKLLTYKELKRKLKF